MPSKFERTPPAKKTLKDVPSEAGHDVGKMGYRRTDFGPPEHVNHRIEGAYVKQATPKDSEHSNIHQIALHQQNSDFHSGDRNAFTAESKRGGKVPGMLKQGQASGAAGGKGKKY